MMKGQLMQEYPTQTVEALEAKIAAALNPDETARQHYERMFFSADGQGNGLRKKLADAPSIDLFTIAFRKVMQRHSSRTDGQAASGTPNSDPLTKRPSRRKRGGKEESAAQEKETARVEPVSHEESTDNQQPKADS